MRPIPTLAATLFLLVPPAGGQERADARLIDVVDGDTLRVRLDGRRVTLRLAAVDTEEKISGRPNGSPTKPQTVFGQETTLWAKEFFAALAANRPDPEGLGLVLLFPEGLREDVYGRLLCHVLLPDGTDFNLKLVQEGRSPYFNKYGNSPIAHEAFVQAQDEARKNQLGLWNPRTNRAATPEAPSAVRPYERLVPWWNARATAIDAFRRQARASPDTVVAADDAAGLAAACERCRSEPETRVLVFATIERIEVQPGGSATVRLRGATAGNALTALVPAAAWRRLEARLRGTVGEFRQNYLWVRGRVERDGRGHRLEAADPSAWAVADPPFPLR